jgi:uncharacterized protein YkwD
LTDAPQRLPRRVVARTIAFGVGALLAAGAVAWTPAAVSAWNQGYAESTLWQLLNGARANNGLRVLQSHATLVSLARWRSSDMLAKNYFSHTIAGCGCLVYAYYDSNGLSYGWAGENIGWNSGQTDDYSPVRVHEQFMGSPGHRANVLDPRFTHGGVGAAAADGKMFQGYVQNTRMYTELFMEAASAAAPPPPPSGGGGGGSGGGSSGGGSGGGSGGSGGSAAPAQPTAGTVAPTASRVEVDAPRRPVSKAGIDGTTTLVASTSRTDLTARHLADERAAGRAAALAAAVTAQNTDAANDGAQASAMEVAAAPPGENPLAGIVGAIIGFLFG